MPFLFPEVFLRDRGGFDVLVGNPPWEKLKVEEHQWWGLRFPGFAALPMATNGAPDREPADERPDLVAEYEARRRARRDCGASLVRRPVSRHRFR